MVTSYKIYRLFSISLSFFVKCYFYIRCFVGKDEKQNVVNHFGQPTIERPKGNVVWMHAASIGESVAAITYIKHFKEKYPDTSVLLTTITLTSANLLRKKFENMPGCYHQFVVADVPGWINRFLDYWQPSKAIFFESEIWPNIVHELHNRNISTYLLNARLSDKSFSRWKTLFGLMHEVLSLFNKILAQSKLDTEKFSFFNTNNVVQIDNLKYANGKLPCDNNLLNVFKSFCSGKKIFVAASTHDGEETIILEAHKIMQTKFPVTTIIIPRHIQRVKQICALCEQMNLAYTIRSKATQGYVANSDIFIVDTYGELGTFFALADVVFVGGSLVKGVGGHNVIEPVEFGKPVLHGQHMENFREIQYTLQNFGVAYEVKDVSEIVNTCINFFVHSELCDKAKETIATKVQNNALEQIDNWI